MSGVGYDVCRIYWPLIGRPVEDCGCITSNTALQETPTIGQSLCATFYCRSQETSNYVNFQRSFLAASGRIIGITGGIFYRKVKRGGAPRKPHLK